MPMSNKPVGGSEVLVLCFAVILKPPLRLDGASIMRHLSVPSAQTQQWLERCRSEKWLAEHTGVSALADGNKAIPLNDSAPQAGDECWMGNALVDLEAKGKPPSHWTEHLDCELYEAHKDDWPKAYETQGDVLIVKIEDGLWDYAEMMADAMLTQLPNIRLVCADLGVHGDFRVRDLHPLATRDGSVETRTRIRENGYLLWVDASKVYFSARLANERLETLATAKRLAARLNRGIVVADPYAGVGPSMGALLGEADLLTGYHAGDLNPDAVELLSANLAQLAAKRKTIDGNDAPMIHPATVVCSDATTWADDETLKGSCDLLLVNLPHDSIEHLPLVLPLLRSNQTSVLRGWAIVERALEAESQQRIEAAIAQAGARIETIVLDEVKGFSASKSFMCFEVWMRLED
jgi:tRNA G37 N-methylase Trm5